MDRYYELVTQDELNMQIAKERMKLIGLRSDFYDPYLVISEYLENKGEYKESRRFAKEAYEKATKRIVDYRGNFPKHMEWGWMENRHIIRSIGNWARILWKEERGEEALVLLRKIFRANPNDNTGCRHDILAIKMGLKHDFLERNFVSDMGEGFLDAGKVSEWFDKNCHKFYDEFDFWFKYIEKREKNG